MADWTENNFKKTKRTINSPTRTQKVTETKLGTFGAASECRSYTIEEATEWMKNNIAELRKKTRIRRPRA